MKNIGNMSPEPQELRSEVIFDQDTRAVDEEHLSVSLSAAQLAVDGVQIVEAFRVEVLAHQAAERKRMFEIGARHRLPPRTPMGPWASSSE